MKSIAAIAAQSVHEARTPREASATTRKLFVVLHGAYGNQFLAKFHTGQLVEDGQNKDKDKGLLAAMLVWDNQLSRFAGDVVQLAAERAQRENPVFAPTLPQLVNLCEALTPVKTYPELNGYAMLPPPKMTRIEVHIELKGDGKDQFRKIWARHLAGDKTLTRFSLKSAIDVLGAEALAMKQEQEQE